jgi:5'-3' exonuclease
MILIDMSQIILGNIFSFGNGIQETDEDLIRHMTLNSIRMYKNKFKSYGDVVLVFDSSNYWRKEIFPQYKAARKLKQNKNAEDWSRIWDSINTIRIELEEQFPYKTMRVERAEADDIIAHLAKKYHQTEKIMIISSDKDYQQLQRYPNISQYSTKTKTKLICKKPQEFLIEHIIRGDSSDGIPNILSDDDAIINKEKRQKRLTKKILDSINEDLAFGELPKGHEEKWKRNQELVDFEKIPDWIINSIEEKWNESIKGKRSNLFNYFIEHRLKNLMEHISEF